MATGRTAHRPRTRGGGERFRRRARVGVCGWGGGIGGARGELSAERFEFLTMGRTEEAIVTHLDKALGQDMLKKAVDEFFDGHCAEVGLARVGFVAERDLVVLDLDDAAVTEGDPKDIGSKILEGDAAIADGLAVDDPILLPHGSGDVRAAIGLAQRIAELGAKEFRERLDREQELFPR